MRKLLLIDYNIASFKLLLKTHFPLIRSSHLSEAIARGLGFNSNAAFLVAIEQSKLPRFELSTFNEKVFSNWLGTKGYGEIDLIPCAVFESVDAPIWLCSKSEIVRDNWYNYARGYNIPTVHIAPKLKFAAVHWDYISVDEHHDASKFTKIDAAKISDQIDKYNGKVSLPGEFKVFTGDVEELTIDEAKLFATEIFSILHRLIGK